MRKLIICLLFLASCTKDEIVVPVAPQPVPSPKNYKLPSYELQQSPVTIDLMALRAKYLVNGPWNIFAVAYLDINGDGNDDIFTGLSYHRNERTAAQLYVYKNGEYVPDNSFFNEIPTFVNPRKAIVGDFNDDKRPDIFVAAHGYDQPPYPGEYTQLILSNSNGKYDVKKFEDKIAFYHGAASGDIDNDGDLDIFVLHRSLSYFLINDGKGNFTYSTSQIDLNDINAQYTCELMDINKDGYIDLVMGGHEFDYNGTTRIYWGNSTHTFTDKTIIPPVKYYGVITDIDMADLDGDGINEMAITRAGGYDNYVNFYDGWYIQILKVDNKQPYDVTNNFIDNNSLGSIGDYNWIVWMRFQDYDKNGKIDFFSTLCSEMKLVRWELENKKLKRIN